MTMEGTFNIPAPSSNSFVPSALVEYGEGVSRQSPGNWGIFNSLICFSSISKTDTDKALGMKFTLLFTEYSKTASALLSEV